jgi:hypothetical protein
MAAYERASRIQIVLWYLIGYIIYASMCFAIESYGRHRFGVQRNDEIERIAERRPRLLAETRRATGLTELQEWLPHQLMATVSLVGSGLLGLVTGFFTVRALIRSRRNRGSIVPIRLLAAAVAFPTLAVFLAGVLPLALAGTLWESQLWLTWPGGR